MTAVAAAAGVGLAAWLLAGPPVRRGVEPRAGVRRRAKRGWLPGLALLVAGLALAAPGRVRTLVVVALLVGLFASLSWRRRRLGKLRRANRDAVARAAWALASEVAAGRVAADALRVVAAEEPVLMPAARIGGLGGDVAACWRQQAAGPGLGALRELAAAWQLCARTGAPLGGALRLVAEGTRRSTRLGHTVDAELAAPRATTRLLAALPLVGCLLGVVVGGDPAGFLLDTNPGQLCLVGAVVLAGVGLQWGEALADRAAAA